MFARWSKIAFVVFVVVAAFFYLHRFFSEKFFDTTGTAEWIWAEHRLASGEPIVFFATRDFDLPPTRSYVRVKAVGDPEYTLFFNGVEIGGGRPGKFRLLDVYDVTKLARDRGNRIVAAMRSANGVGGFLLAIDLSPTLENFVVSDRRWTIYRAWHPDLLRRNVAQIRSERPRSLGRPPFGRWNYLTENARPLFSSSTQHVEASAISSMRTTLDGIKVASGVAVATSTPVNATVFDFNRVRGRTRIELSDEGPRVVRVRYAANEDDLVNGRATESFVIAPGERAVVDSEERVFRYVVVYGANAKVSVLKRQ